MQATDHTNLRSIYAHIDANTELFVSRLLEYVSHPSISTRDIGIREVATKLHGMFQTLGLDVETIETPGNPVVMARWEKKPGALTVLLYGHYDVQPPEPLDAWTTPPFSPSIRDGRIFARGVGDNKGQHFAQMLALESHLAIHGELPCNVIFMLDGEEEVGSPSIPGFVADFRDRLKADLVVTSDGSLHSSGRPIIQFGVRGLLNFELHAQGATRDVHSGNFGGIVPNPLWTLVQLLATMKNAKGEITIDGLLDNVVAPTQAELAAVSALPVDMDYLTRHLGLAKMDDPQERQYFERLMFHPTLTINGMHGGYDGPGMKTVIPHRAYVKCDMRLIEAQTPDEVFALVQRHVARYAPDVEVVRLNSMLPSKTPVDSPFTAAIVKGVTSGQSQAPLLYPTVGASLPDYVFTKILGIPAFLIPYANADQSNHAPNENLRIECFLNGIRTGAAILDALADARAE